MQGSGRATVLADLGRLGLNPCAAASYNPRHNRHKKHEAGATDGD